MLFSVLVVVLQITQASNGPTVADVRATLAAARTEIETYRAARSEFEAWARTERAAIERERSALRARAARRR